MWLLIAAPGLLIIRYGVHGIMDERLRIVGFRRTTPNKEALGDEAVAWGAFYVAVGVWALGQGFYLKTQRTAFKFAGWILAAGAASVGVWILVRDLGP